MVSNGQKKNARKFVLLLKNNVKFEIDKMIPTCLNEETGLSVMDKRNEHKYRKVLLSKEEAVYFKQIDTFVHKKY